MTLTIYGCYRSRASRNIWLAKELGLAFNHVPVIQVYRLPDPNAADAPLHTQSPAFLAVNPKGQIPAIDDDGFKLQESLAINLYLARKHGGPLAPKDAQEEGLAVMWSLWASTAVEPHALNINYHMAAYPPEKRDPKLVDAQYALMQFHLMAPGMMGGDEDEAIAIAERIAALSAEAIEGNTLDVVLLSDEDSHWFIWC